MTDDQLALRGLHPDLSKVTLAQLLAAWAARDLNHIPQIARAVAYQSRELLGPWARYISTLT